MLRAVPNVHVHVTIPSVLGTGNPRRKKLSDCTGGALSLRRNDWRAVRSSVRSGGWGCPQPLMVPAPHPFAVIMSPEARRPGFKSQLNSGPLSRLLTSLSPSLLLCKMGTVRAVRSVWVDGVRLSLL